MPKWKKFSPTILINITPQGGPAEIFCKCQQNLLVGSACCKEDGLVWQFFVRHLWSFSWSTYLKKKGQYKSFLPMFEISGLQTCCCYNEKRLVWNFPLQIIQINSWGPICCKVWFDNLFVNDPDHLLGRPIAKKRSATPLITSTFYLSAPKSCGSHLYLRAIPCRPLNIPALPHSIARTLPSLRSGITLFRFHKHHRQ